MFCMLPLVLSLSILFPRDLEIERLGDETGKGKSLKIIVDTTDGFSWPWVWYLRGYPSVFYLCLSEDSNCSKIESPPDADVVLLAQRNNVGVAEFMGEFGDSVEYKHRWWFPSHGRPACRAPAGCGR